MKRRIPNGTAGPSATHARVIKKLAPDQNGAGRHHERHGDSLVCVRYREDAYQRYTTIELVVDTRPLPARDGIYVGVEIPFHQTQLRQRVKEAGGIWDNPAKLWRLLHSTALSLGLAERIRKFYDA